MNPKIWIRKEFFKIQ